MGFGMLFVGYFITYLMSFHPLGALTRLVGYVMILRACLRLKDYQPSFLFPAVGSLLLSLISAVSLTGVVTNYLYENLFMGRQIFTSATTALVEWINVLLVFAFHLVLYYAIHKIAKDTEIGEITVNAVRNLLFFCLYFVCYFLGRLESLGNEMRSYINLAAIILLFTWVILDLILIFSCYAKICDEGDTEMAQKPSRFAFVNRLRSKMDKSEEKAHAETRAYREEKRERRNQRREGKGKKNE